LRFADHLCRLEYSGRGGLRVYTQCLIVPPDVLARFANSPFALMRAAVASGVMQVFERVPRRLEPLSLVGGAAPVDQTLLARLAVNPGAQRMAALTQAALDATRLAVAGTPSAGDLIAGLLSCLPPPCRPAFSFCTGLKFSSRRPFRLVGLSGDSAEKRWVAHQRNVTVLDLSEGVPLATGPIDGWARLITRVLASGRIAFLAAQLSKRRFDLTPADLPALGLQLLEELDASAFAAGDCPDFRAAGDCPNFRAAKMGLSPSECEKRPSRARVEKEDNADGPSFDPGVYPLAPGRAHAAHLQFVHSTDAATAAKLAAVAPSQSLEAASPEILEKLEHLDDVVYEALCGQETALRELQTLWPAVLADLGEDFLAESREQYLRYALAISEQCVSADGIRDPARAVQALDVLCLLFNDA